MRIRYQKLKGMEVLADKEGRLLGSVRRLQLDSKKKVAVGLVFKGKLMSGEHWARVAGISRVGEDVVFLSAMRVVREDEPSGRDLKDLIGLPVNTLDGKRLGSLDDVIIELDGWKIAGLVLDSGGAVEIGPDAVFGEDTVLLRSGAADEVVEEIPEQGGFLARVFSSDAPAARKPGRARRKTSRRR